jgi:hypothetical protein
MYGRGGLPRTDSFAGASAAGYGGGGSGAASGDPNTTDLAGGDGTPGVCIVWEYTEA